MLPILFKKCQPHPAFLTPDAKSLQGTHIYAICRLDYSNSLLCVTNVSPINRVRQAQNAGARLILFALSRDNATPLIFILHRLQVVFRILIFVYNALPGKVLRYISEHLAPNLHIKTLRSLHLQKLSDNRTFSANNASERN